MSVMIGTKVKDAANWLPRFISQVEQLQGEISRVVVIYGESTDQSFALLKHWKKHSKHKIEIYQEPYLPPEERHGATLTRLKQDLQELLKAGQEKYYLNLDCDLIKLPSSLVPNLMACDKDLIASMVWTEGREPPVFFDIFEFRKEGAMFYPYDPPGKGASEPFTVDSVSTCYLAKAEVELAGVYSNPYPHIPFCKSLKDKGYQIWVDPKSNVYHYDLERIGILHPPLNHPYARVPFITSTGQKVEGARANAERFVASKESYEQELRRRYQLDTLAINALMDQRPLITASIKALNEAEYIQYCLDSIYPYVDRIDIVYGPVAQASHITYRDNTPNIILNYPDKDHKITLVTGKWQSKEHVQAKLLELCESKWLLFIDADEVIKPSAGEALRQFAFAQQSNVVYARPARFYHFLHDLKHIAYSLNPLSPWAEYGTPHPFLIWRDITGLNFNAFHTQPSDVYGDFIHVDNSRYRGRQKVIDEVEVYHFGNAKNPQRTMDKIVFERRRDHNPSPAEKDWWFTGELPQEFVVVDFDQQSLPAMMRSHPYYDLDRIKVTQTTPNYKFEVIK